jgi:hypothetical protein
VMAVGKQYEREGRSVWSDIDFAAGHTSCYRIGYRPASGIRLVVDSRAQQQQW